MFPAGRDGALPVALPGVGIRTGRFHFDPGRAKTRRFEAEAESGAVLPDQGRRDGTFAVRVENVYVVVDA